MALLLVIAGWLTIGVAAVAILRHRGHDTFAWSVIFLFMGPLAIPLAVSADRNRPSEPARPTVGELDVLVAHDGTEEAGAALDLALRLLGRPDDQPHPGCRHRPRSGHHRARARGRSGRPKPGSRRWFLRWRRPPAHRSTPWCCSASRPRPSGTSPPPTATSSSSGPVGWPAVRSASPPAARPGNPRPDPRSRSSSGHRRDVDHPAADHHSRPPTERRHRCSPPRR